VQAVDEKSAKFEVHFLGKSMKQKGDGWGTWHLDWVPKCNFDALQGSNLREPRKAPETLLQLAQVTRNGSIPHASTQESRGLLLLARRWPVRALALLLTPMMVAAAGCSAGHVAADSSNATFSISPGTNFIDTNCTGCNGSNAKGTSVEQFAATLSSGGPAAVTWSVSGGDANSGPGSISSSGQYTPPPYLTADRVAVLVTATLNPTTTATAVLTVTPGFLQPMTPENAALGANGQVIVTGYIAGAGGYTSINYALSSTPTGATGGQGSLGTTNCQRTAETFTFCTVTYTAPTQVSATGATYVVATVGTSPSKTAAIVLLNTAGVSSSPASHQVQAAAPVALGSSGGNNNDYDVKGNQIVDCCGGTLGSLIQDNSNHQYLLSNNHVLARSDHASVGDAIIQPGLIDNNCTPNGDGAGTTPVGSLTGWLALSSSATNADAAIAQVNSGAVSASGSILELGGKQADGTLAAAPPGVSSTGGKGETGSLNLLVAKSGRTTGLTCGSISALNLDVTVDYYLDCAETKPYLTKTYTNQLAISGNQFSDAGDSGSLVVDTTNSEPVGLYFTGGIDASGVSQGVASPATDVLNELSAQVGGGRSYTFVGGADHPASCMNYGDSTVHAAQVRTLPDTEITRAQQALGSARMLVNPAAGILGVAAGKSSDHPGEGAVVIYVDEAMNATAPATVDGVRTLVIPTNSHAVAFGSAPLTAVDSISAVPGLTAAVLGPAIVIKQQLAHSLMRQNPAFFGVGVGQSLDNPKEAALVIYADRKQLPGQLLATVDGLRTRYVVMDRMHVTLSYAAPMQSRLHCVPHRAAERPGALGAESFNPANLLRPRSLKLQ
jgi:hypothetical protein